MQQTALDLVAKGYDVHVVADGVSSRTQVDRMFALEVSKYTYMCCYSTHYGEFKMWTHTVVVPTFDILTCDDVLLPRAESTGAIKF